MHKGSLSHKKKSLSLKSWMHKKQNPEKFPTPIQFTFTLGTIKLEHTPSIPHQPRLLLIFFNSTISIINCSHSSSMASQNPPPFSDLESAQPSKSNNFSYSNTQILHKLKSNLSFRSKCCDGLNGAMGDLGTYIPIVLALTLARDLNLGTILIFTGIFNAITGAAYGVRMFVQPMKFIVAESHSHSIQ